MAKTSVDASQVTTQLEQQLPISQKATTSRVLVNNDLLRVVAFAMDQGQELTDHATPRAVVVTAISGVIRFDVDEDRYTLGPGDTVYLAPQQRHAVLALSPCRFSLTMIAVSQAPE